MAFAGWTAILHACAHRNVMGITEDQNQTGSQNVRRPGKNRSVVQRRDGCSVCMSCVVVSALYLLPVSSISSSRLYPVQSLCCFQCCIPETNWGGKLLGE